MPRVLAALHFGALTQVAQMILVSHAFTLK
jgi:hypothetical protein